MAVYLIGTLDTKGTEVDFVRQLLTSYGVAVRVVDAGCLGVPTIDAEISRADIYALAGVSVETVRDQGDRGRAVALAAAGVARLIKEAHAAGNVDGVMGLGGSAGTTIATAGMRELPVGVPKMMVSTLASGDVRPWVGDKDILMMNSIVDIAGINRISRAVLGEAARAMAGMVTLPPPLQVANSKLLIAATMFGVTTPCVQAARSILEQAGYEVLVFHATGNGGQAMESLISDGLIAGVLDITTTELADEIVGGILSAGPDRLTAAGRRGIPQVVSVGATDMVNFGPPDTIPERFAHRKFYEHNPSVTLMRTTPEECTAIGRDIGAKVDAAEGPAVIMLPLRGVSAIDAAGQPFDDSEARRALFDGIRQTAGTTEIVVRDAHINDPGFAFEAARRLVEMLESESSRSPQLNEGGSIADACR